MTKLSILPSRWVDADQIVRAMACAPSRKHSSTMEHDKSQPPTPDGTGLPENFQQIAPGLYRSSYPSYPHYQSLRDLQLKTIVTLVSGSLSLDYSDFISTEGIIHYQIPIIANKDASVFSPAETVHQVLKLLLDPSNFPILIHCNKGRHRTGCMVACFRKVIGWTLDACLDEYVRYSTPKSRELDKKFIGAFDPVPLKSIAYDRGYIGGVYKQPLGVSEESTRSSVATNNTADTYTSTEEDHPNHEYQEAARRAHNELMESSRLWSTY